MTDEERYWAKVDKNGPEAKCIETSEDLGRCWAWTAYTHKDGHGQFRFNGKQGKAHRVAWHLEHGETPEGMLIHHRCENPGCQNVAHMEVMTRSEHQKLHNPKATHCRKCKVEVTEENTYKSDRGMCKKCNNAESYENQKKRKAKKLREAA